MTDVNEERAAAEVDTDTVHDESVIAKDKQTEAASDQDKICSSRFEPLSGRHATCDTLTVQSSKDDADGDTLASSSGEDPTGSAKMTREEEDEAFQRAQAMALAMANNPNLPPEELMLICSPDEQQRKLVQERRKGKKTKLWEETLAGKNLSTWLGGSGKDGVMGVLHKSFQPETTTCLKSDSASDSFLLRGRANTAPLDAHSTSTSFDPEFSPTTADDDSSKKKGKSLQDSLRAHREKAKWKVPAFEKRGSLTQDAPKSPNPDRKATLSPKKSPFGAAKNGEVKSASTTPVAIPCKVNGGGSSKPFLPFVPQMGSTASPTSSPIPNAVSSIDTSITPRARSASATTASATTLPSFILRSTPLLTTGAVKPVTSALTPTKQLQPPPKNQSSRNASFDRTTSPINDMISDPSYMRGDEEETPTISGIIWKRRSGLGKLSAKHAWEKRRITLSGSKIMYYKTSEEAAEESEQQDSRRSVATTGSFGALDSKPKLWWEQAALNFQTAKENLAQTLAAAGLEVPTDPNAPRGVLDLAKEPHPSVAATTGHSGAPSPFAISIQVKGETKWKFCFENQKQQMQWLTALTDVIVSMSVDEYNFGLVKLESLGLLGDPAKSTLVGGVGESALQQYNSLVASSIFHAPPGRKERLWRLEHYTVSSSKLTDGSDGGLNGADVEKEAEEAGNNNGEEVVWNKEEDEENDDEDSEEEVEDEELVEEVERAEREKDVNTNVMESAVTNDAKATEAPDAARRNLRYSSSSVISTRSLSYSLVPISSTKFKPSWSLEGDGLYGVLLIVNVALFCCRASSIDARSFWFIVMLVNMAAWLLVSKTQPSSDGTIKESDGEPLRKKGVTRVKKRVRSSAFASEAKGCIEADGSLLALSVAPFKPVAGTSALRVKHHLDSPMKDGERFTAWATVHRSEFQVRSHGYLATKKKVPSALELYTVARVDVFESSQRVPDIAPKVILPEVTFDDNDVEKNWHSPDIFIVSLAVPTEVPSLRRATEDGPGFTIVIYYVMREETRKVLRRVTADEYDPASDTTESELDVQERAGNSVRLFEEWCRRAPTDPSFMGRFKLIPNAQNLKEIGMPSYMAKYAGKPVLIKRAGVTGFVYQHPDLNVMEFSISIHPFPYLAKQATAYLKDNIFKKVLVSFGFVIEGRSDEELPEVLIGEAVQLCYPDPAFCIQASDFFAGTSRQSFHLKDDQE